MAINAAGNFPPQETGLVSNSWYGRFHYEMYWWHAAHYGLWDRWPWLNNSLHVYSDNLASSINRAKSQGYAGARWPKCTGPDGHDIFKRSNKRTYVDVRASNAFASSYPAALYSDTYNHDQYIKMILTSGFSGMIWSPEVRESNSIKDFMRRSQTAVLSAQTLFNSWYLQNPPWLQINVKKNNNGELMNNAKQIEADIRKLFEFRMSLIPYLYNAFAQYHFKGIPPFRALVKDYPEDKNTFNLADEYLIGDGILAAPLTAEMEERKVYLPAGIWYDFNTNQKYEGGKSYTIKTSLTELPYIYQGRDDTSFGQAGH